MTQPYTDADIWAEYARAVDMTPLSVEQRRNVFDCTQASRANFDKALHSTQLEPPASGLRNLAAWLAVLLAAGVIGAAIVARRGR